MLQHITYNAWLPKILGKATYNTIIGEYKGYNPDVNPTIANEFATAALRFAHTLINTHLFRFDKDFKETKQGHLPLHNVSVFESFSFSFKRIFRLSLLRKD